MGKIRIKAAVKSNHDGLAVRLTSRKTIQGTLKIKINRLLTQNRLTCCCGCFQQIRMGIGRCCDQHGINSRIGNDVLAAAHSSVMHLRELLGRLVKLVRHRDQFTLRVRDNIYRMDLPDASSAQQTYFKHSDVPSLRRSRLDLR